MVSTSRLEGYADGRSSVRGATVFDGERRGRNLRLFAKREDARFRTLRRRHLYIQHHILEQKLCLQHHHTIVDSLTFSLCNSHLLSGDVDQPLRMWDCNTEHATFRGHGDGTQPVVLSPWGKQIASFGNSKLVGLQYVQYETGSSIITVFGRVFTGGAYSLNGLDLALGGTDGKMRLFDTQAKAYGQVFVSELGVVACVTYSSDSRRIVSGYVGGSFHLWEVAVGKPGLQWRGHFHAISSANFSPNEKWIASCSANYAVKLWDAHIVALVSICTGHWAEVKRIVFSPDSLQLASCSWDYTVRL